VRAARHLWTTRRQRRMRAEPHRLVFLDETAVKTNLTRLRGWAPVGQRLYGSAPFGKWRTQTFIAGLTSNELIAPWVIEGAMNQAAFETYVETQLVPLLSPGTVVILDNLSTHKSPRAAEALRRPSPGSSFCRPTAPISTPSSRPSQNSRPTSGASAREPTTISSPPSAMSAPSSIPQSAGTSSMLPDMLQIKDKPL
jgi:hypothetical protein